MDVEKEIELVNLIIEEAIVTGGDSGGCYGYTSEYLEYLMKQWLIERGLTDRYGVTTISEDDGDGENTFVHFELLSYIEDREFKKAIEEAEKLF